MSNLLEKLRETLDEIISEAATDLDARAAAQLAAAADALERHTPQAVAAAVQDALDRQRQWFIGLINERLDMLGKQTSTAIVLRHLREVVRGNKTNNGDDQ
jgi:hypothetical protein